MPPRVSVVMSVFNGRPFVAGAVESVLNQSFPDFEFIIIDDASADDSSTDLAQLARRDSRIVLLKNQENLGLTRSLNRGLAEARGEFIARQDADDISAPDRFSKQVAAFKADDDLALLGTGVIEIDDQGRRGMVSLQPSLQAVIQRKILFENAFFHPSVMWRRKAFADSDLTYDEQYVYGQDYELFSRAVWRLKASNLQEPLLSFRAHAGQVSKGRAEAQQKLADGVAWRNFENFGLADEFSRDEVVLLRSLGWRSSGLDMASRRRQWRLWRRLFGRLDQGLDKTGQLQWQAVKKVRLMLLRRSLAAWPPVLPELAGVLASDPWGAVQDMASVAARRLKVGG
jgi:glycosyltransferase involved in cell wall biosynthesis